GSGGPGLGALGMSRRVAVLDFEATCDDVDPPDPQEVIEFPSVLVDLDTKAVVDEFSTFVRPVHHPRLTPFCTSLTGITDADLTTAPAFPEVFEAHQRWLADHGHPVIATCGDWDLAKLLPTQIAASGLRTVPPSYRAWINVKVPFGAWKGPGARMGMPGMLEALGLPLIGRHHRGIDDARNIARIVLALAERGVDIEPTGRLAPSRYPSVRIVLVREGREAEVTLERRTLPSLLGLASGTHRRQATGVLDVDGRELTDEDLLDLRDGDRLSVLGPPLMGA
ncbi:MAG: exonuclease domain-containing protein, partial [Myxococcales bacterium]|nr:exonuclease domain-containing protein [Myxococcales bacterium]